MTLDSIYPIISSIITTPLAFLFIFMLSFQWKYTTKTMIKIAAVYLLCVALINLGLFHFLGVSSQTKFLAAVFNILSSILFNVIFSHHADIQLLFSYTNACIFIFVSDTLTGILVPEAGLWHILSKVFIFGVVAVILYFCFRPSLLDTVLQLKKTRKWYMLFPAFLCLLLFLIIQGQGPLYSYPQFQPVILLLCFCSICVYISYFLAFSAIRKQSTAETDKSVLQTQVQALEKQLSLVQQSNEQTAVFLHDIRHFYQVQSAYLEKNDTEGALKALHTLCHTTESACKKAKVDALTGYVPLDSLIAYYNSLMEENGIQFIVRLDIHDINANITEFTVVLSNALENAYHACCNQPESTKRTIRLLGSHLNDKIYLEVSNTYSGEISFNQEGLPESQIVNHGYGTKSISYFTRKHDGYLNCFTKDGWYYLQMVL